MTKAKLKSTHEANQEVKLGKIASIYMGYPFRTRVERDPEGTVGVIQMKDIDDYNRLNLTDVYKLQLEDLSEKHLLKQNDLLFRSRGVTNTTALVTEKIEPYVAASPLIVIRAKSSHVNPAYLAWYLNHPYGQKQINRFAEGTSQRMVSKLALAELVIDLPPLAIQEAIVQVAELNQREQQLMQELAQKRKVYIDAVLMQKAVGQSNQNTSSKDSG
ncbi:restriction endonuclease subunit S [Nostoc sp. FACHB-190]|uniref:restriction endonuclease subunit S n=1 Tax=Nostoc sp. FACHB-190 TaxID=2692838 RepID=UPI0016830688|nr:restriction endonuclease subunit S [Nostoc sp. FACHB-190]MBD2302221.1 restriction endonuclease subunit S [Nostoc sp. FACHB-190]